MRLKYSNKSILLNLMAFLFLHGCASDKQIAGPDGTVHHLIRSGSMQLIYEKAHEVCKGPYQIVNASKQLIVGGPVIAVNNELLVKCDKQNELTAEENKLKAEQDATALRQPAANFTESDKDWPRRRN